MQRYLSQLIQALSCETCRYLSQLIWVLRPQSYRYFLCLTPVLSEQTYRYFPMFYTSVEWTDIQVFSHVLRQCWVNRQVIPMFYTRVEWTDIQVFPHVWSQCLVNRQVFPHVLHQCWVNRYTGFDSSAKSPDMQVIPMQSNINVYQYVLCEPISLWEVPLWKNTQLLLHMLCSSAWCDRGTAVLPGTHSDLHSGRCVHRGGPGHEFFHRAASSRFLSCCHCGSCGRFVAFGCSELRQGNPVWRQTVESVKVASTLKLGLFCCCWKRVCNQPIVWNQTIPDSGES